MVNNELHLLLSALDIDWTSKKKKEDLTLEELTLALDTLWSKSLSATPEEKMKLKDEAKEYAVYYKKLNPSGYKPPYCR